VKLYGSVNVLPGGGGCGLGVVVVCRVVVVVLDVVLISMVVVVVVVVSSVLGVVVVVVVISSVLGVVGVVVVVVGDDADGVVVVVVLLSSGAWGISPPHDVNSKTMHNIKIILNTFCIYLSSS
jgi:hypothetical protein